MKTYPRRMFLSQTARTSAALPLLLGGSDSLTGPSVRAAGSPANEKIGIGLIGCGGMGRGDLATFLSNPEVMCPVICDVDDWMLSEGVKLFEQKQLKQPDTVKDFRRVLDRRDVDAVVVATPDHWHALATIYACQAGKDVYVEKPLATSITEGRAMVTAAQRYYRVVQMGTQWRSGEHWQEAVQFVRSSQLGKIGLVRGWAYHDWLEDIGNPPDRDPPGSVDYDFWLGPAPKRTFNPNRFHFNFRWFWDYAGGLMTDWGVHLINIMLWAMGMDPPRTVSSTGGKFVLTDNTETPDTQITVYEFPTYTLVWEHKVGVGIGLNGRPWGISFTGTDGTLIVDDGGWEILPEKKKLPFDPRKFPGSGDSRPAHVRNFLDCVKSRQEPVENLEVGHFVSTVAHLGNISLRSGHKIAWDAEAEKVVGDEAADRYVTVPYRKPWRLPYNRRG